MKHVNSLVGYLGIFTFLSQTGGVTTRRGKFQLTSRHTCQCSKSFHPLLGSNFSAPTRWNDNNKSKHRTQFLIFGSLLKILSMAFVTDQLTVNWALTESKQIVKLCQPETVTSSNYTLLAVCLKQLNVTPFIHFSGGIRAGGGSDMICFRVSFQPK